MIDKSKALGVFHITEQEYDEMLLEFVAQAKEQSIALGSAIQRGAFDEAAVLAHSLKGVSGNLRLDNCFTIARNIEFAIKENKTTDISGHLQGLDSSIDEVRNSVAK